MAIPELPRDIACAITLKAKEMEAGMKPAAMVVEPESRTLLAFRRQAAGSSSSKVVAVLGRWSVDGSGKLAVLGQAAVQLEVNAKDSFEDDSLLISAFVAPNQARHTFFVSLLSCAVLDALLDNKLLPADTKAALTCPEKCRLFFLAESHDGHIKSKISRMNWALELIDSF
ncbi:hypothetical protein ABPG77_006211 [Micractinium sp. CCAP 211/92]